MNIGISEDGSDERAEWDQRIYAVTGRRWYNLMDQNVQALRDGVEKVARQYAAEQVAAALAAPAPLTEQQKNAQASRMLELVAAAPTPPAPQAVVVPPIKTWIERRAEWFKTTTYKPKGSEIDAPFMLGEIRDLRAALASSPVAQQQGWISVEDWLPKCSKKIGSVGEEVFVWPPFNGERTAFFGRRCSDTPKFYKFGAVLYGVRYWMPLPISPFSPKEQPNA